MLLVGEDQKFIPVVCLPLLVWPIPLLIFLLTCHSQGQRGDFLQIPLPGQKQVYNIVGRGIVLIVGRLLDVVVENFRAPRRPVFLFDLLQFLDDEALGLPGGFDRSLKAGNFLLQRSGFFCALEDVLLVDVPQPNIGHVFRLHLVQAKASHQIRDDLGVLLRLPDDFDRLVDVQKNKPQAFEQMQFLRLFLDGKLEASPDTLRPPGNPLIQNVPNSKHLRHPIDKDIEVARLAVHQGRQLEEPIHNPIRVGAAFQVDSQFQAIQVGFVPNVRNFLDFPCLDQLYSLFNDSLDGCGIGNLENFDEILLLAVPPLGPDLERASACVINLRHGGGIIEKLTAGGQVRGWQGCHNIVVLIL